uniref:Uncharacterized protein n=1 Tax=Kalanchoe fedtschenkoi TaxID=63787 RepID=A0A7N0V221_KALFE
MLTASVNCLMKSSNENFTPIFYLSNHMASTLKGRDQNATGFGLMVMAVVGTGQQMNRSIWWSSKDRMMTPFRPA